MSHGLEERASGQYEPSFYRSILEASPSPVIVLEHRDREYTIVYWNAAFETRTGHVIRDEGPVDWRVVFGTDAGELHRLRAVLESGEAARANVRTHCSDGSSFWSELQIAPVEYRAQTTHHVCLLRDLTREWALRQHLERRAHYDPLTGLPNRHLLQDRLDRAIVRARSGNQTFAVAVIDLDNFKEVNDTLGHQAGDELLRQIGARLSAGVRSEDTIARIGGDEFVLLLESASSETWVSDTLATLLGVIEMPVTLANTNRAIGCSVGVSWYPFDGQDAAALLEHADLSMYGVKKHNRLHPRPSLNQTLPVRDEQPIR